MEKLTLLTWNDFTHTTSSKLVQWKTTSLKKKIEKWMQEKEEKDMFRTMNLVITTSKIWGVADMSPLKINLDS